MTFKPFHIESLDTKNVTRITARRNMSIAFGSESEVYTWGTFPKGLALSPKQATFDIPQIHEKLS